MTKQPVKLPIRHNDYYYSLGQSSIYKFEIFMVDLAQYGNQLYETLLCFFKSNKNNTKNPQSLARTAYNSILDDLARFLNNPPAESFQRVIEFTDFSYGFEVFDTDIEKKLDELNPLIHSIVISLYMQLRGYVYRHYGSKLVPGSTFSPIEIGLDYVLMRANLRIPMTSREENEDERLERTFSQLEDQYMNNQF